jgi:3-oxoacyl-[acyl-carrier protein] reductase
MLTPPATRLRASTGTGADSSERLRKVEGMLPMGRVTEPVDIANAAWYLGSDESSYVTGTTLEVDGGRGI